MHAPWFYRTFRTHRSCQVHRTRRREGPVGFTVPPRHIPDHTPAVVVRLNVGIGHQTGGGLDWDGRVFPGLDVWQMDVGVVGLSLENEDLTGTLGETARPVYDKDGEAVIKGDDAFRRTAEDYRVSGGLGADFALPHHK
ncbi:unnamed protein product [Ectocarpus sp. 13 AM-2016]